VVTTWVFQLNSGKHRIFPVHFAPGKKLFHIVVKLSDAPGSYSSVLDLLRTKVNLIGTSTYALDDGTAMFSGFSEALSPTTTSKELRDLILRSKAAIEASVAEGVDGLLVDTFHTGFQVGNEDYILQTREGVAHMFDHVAKILGSGGEALLYEEGMAVSQWNAEAMVKLLGVDRVRAQIGKLNKFMTAQGWGVIDLKEGTRKGEFTVDVTDCFECSGKGTSRPGCSFMRGYLTGAAVVIYGHEYDSRETKCVLKGAKICQFSLVPRK